MKKQNLIPDVSSLCFTISFVLSIITLTCSAYYGDNGLNLGDEDSNLKQQLYNYYSGSGGLLLKDANTKDLGASYQLAESPSLGYLTQPADSQGNNELDDRKLIDFLKQLQTLSNDGANFIDLDLDNSISVQPPNVKSSSVQESISGPINDLAKYEAFLSRILGSKGTHEQSGNKNASIDDLFAIYKGTIMQKPGEDSTGATKNDATTEVARDTPLGPRYAGGEYIDHPLALEGHQYVQGGAGEGRQLLGPEGTFENKQVVKSDHAVPSYCDPPNPCPIGFTAKDGCLEKFVNSASFSREYQIKQQCPCDEEHSLFNCDSPVSTGKGSTYESQSPLQSLASNEDRNPTGSFNANSFKSSSKVDTLARAIQNRFGSLASVRNIIAENKDTSDGHLID